MRFGTKTNAKSLWGNVSDMLFDLECGLKRAKEKLQNTHDKPLDKPLVYATPLWFKLEIEDIKEIPSEIEALDKILELLEEIKEIEADIFYSDEED